MTLDQPLTPERTAELRRMTPEEKLKLAQKMYWDARWAKADETRAQNPDWSEWALEQKVKMSFLAQAMKED